MRNYAVLALMAAGLTACTYAAPVPVTPNLNVYSSYGDKLPGSYLLYIDDDSFIAKATATGTGCSFHSYPVDLRESFKQSALATIEQLVETVQVVDAPVSASQLAAQGKRGMIIVKADNIEARFLIVPGFWSANADSNVDLSASISVDGAAGRLLGTTAEGAGHASGPAGGFCGDVATVVGEATQKAMKTLLGQLGERMSNSQRLRAPSGAASL